MMPLSEIEIFKHHFHKYFW